MGELFVSLENPAIQKTNRVALPFMRQAVH